MTRAAWAMLARVRRWETGAGMPRPVGGTLVALKVAGYITPFDGDGGTPITTPEGRAALLAHERRSSSARQTWNRPASYFND